MEISQIIPHIEALIFASDKALSTAEITELINTALGFIEDRADAEQVEVAIQGIREKYSSEFYAFELKQSGGGWQFLTKAIYHKTVALLNGDKFLKRLSTAALETLSIIAYKQPITKGEIESIRGVNCDYAVQKLLEKDLIVITGRNEDAVGKPLIYATSKSFMDYFGINSASELPQINEVFLEEIVKASEVAQLNASMQAENNAAVEEEVIEQTDAVENEAETVTVEAEEANEIKADKQSEESEEAS
jgi:segregation and condensation protein B